MLQRDWKILRLCSLYQVLGATSDI